MDEKNGQTRCLMLGAAALLLAAVIPFGVGSSVASEGLPKAGAHRATDKTPKLTRTKTRNAALTEGSRRAGKAVEIDYMVREARDEFSAGARWMKRTRTGPKSCTVGIRIFRKKKLRATSDRLIECRDSTQREFLDDQFQRGPGPKYCPGNDGETWNARSKIEGRTLEEATRIARAHDCQVRVVRRDGVYLLITMDLSFNRLNFEVEGLEQRVVHIAGVF